MNPAFVRTAAPTPRSTGGDGLPSQTEHPWTAEAAAEWWHQHAPNGGGVLEDIGDVEDATVVEPIAIGDDHAA